MKEMFDRHPSSIRKEHELSRLGKGVLVSRLLANPFFKLAP